MPSMLTYRGAVFASHCDHLGHMNNMWYAAKFEEGSWNALAQIGFTAGHMRETRTALAAVEQATAFRRELLAGDTVEVWTRIVEVKDKIVRMEHAMHNVETGELCATSAITAVHIDLNQRRAIPIPELQRRMALDVLEMANAA